MPKDMLSKMGENLKSFWQVNNLRNDKTLLVLTIIYLLVLTLLHWRLSPKLEILFFLAGGILGVYFLDLAEAIFKVSPSPFKNVLFQVIFVPFSLFILTSSGSLFGTGLVLSMFLSMLFQEGRELLAQGNINRWFWPIKREINLRTQQIYLLVMMVVFSLLSLLFA